MDNNNLDRIVKIAVALGLAALILMMVVVTYLSFEISNIKKSIDQFKTEISSSQIENVDKINSKIAGLSNNIKKISFQKSKDGKDGENGDRGEKGDSVKGEDGVDSKSTHTIERVVIKESESKRHNNDKPEQELEKPRQKEYAQNAIGLLFWKYEDDREWIRVPTIDLDLTLGVTKR